MGLTDIEPEGKGSQTLSGFDHFLSIFEDFTALLSGLAIFGLMLLGVTNIFLRKVVGAPIFGYIDLVEISMASFAFLGAAYTQRLGGHIRMEILMGKLSGRTLWFIEAIGALLGMFIISVLIIYGWDHFYRAYDLGDTTIDAEYALWPSKLLVPVAFSFWLARLTLQFIGALRLTIDPHAKPIGVVVMKDAAAQAKDEIREAFGTSHNNNKFAEGPES